MLRTAVVTIDIDPQIPLGPPTPAWPGLTIALGSQARSSPRGGCECGMDIDPMYNFGALAALGGIGGARSSTSSSMPGRDTGARPAVLKHGFTFDGGVILAAPADRRRRASGAARRAVSASA